MDAADTAVSVIEDYLNGILTEKSNGGSNPTQTLSDMLKQRNVRYVTFADWKKLDEYEVKQGQNRGSPREKVVDVQKMLNIINSS